MRFARVGQTGSETPVVFVHDQWWSLAPITHDITGRFLEIGQQAVHAALNEGLLQPIDVNGMRVGPPIARPSAVICIGMNYAAHAAESGSSSPENVVVFLKAPNTIAGPFDDVIIPPGSEKTDWEVELGVVIKTRASYLPDIETAHAHIAGYVLANDISERAWQLEVSGGQWSKGKSAPGFLPLGPWLATADELDPTRVRLQSSVNRELRQDSSTKDMIFDVPYIVWHLSQFMILEPGDLILTGTPEGVALSGRFPYLVSGDTVELSIEGLGTQKQRFV